MRFKLLPAPVFFMLLFSQFVGAQDFSNKGKDFWVVYTGHIDGTNSRMALYITSDQNATGTVSVAGNVINFTVTANQVTTVRLTNTSVPSNAVAYNAQTVGIGVNKGIHIVTDHPVVVYAHILNSARSGSTLVLPTNVLGREYYVATYKSVTQSGQSLRRSQFSIVASEDSTTVEITPNVADANNTYQPNLPFQVTLNKGDVFQYQSANDFDLTGSHIKSIATATHPCKPIAVYAGSTWTALGCTSASSGDNLYQEIFPFVSWGKTYYTAPFRGRSFDIFRILVQDPTTVVTVNGVALSSSALIAGRYYEINTQGNNSSRIITSDKPICVFQYMITQNCDNVNSDPEMVILNSIEQTLNDITVMSARNDLTPPNTNITAHYLNIIFKTSAFSSLLIDGLAPASAPVAIPGTGYSYIQENVTTSTNTNPAHRITSDSGFICIAYGYGNVESYGYNAGTNVKDLYQFISLQNQYATVDFPAACKGSPFYFSTTFPYQPTQIRWLFSGLFADTTVNAPVYDSTWTVNGKQLYKYKLPSPYIINTIGSYPIKIIALNPTPDGCSGEQEVNYDLQVFDRPVADFSFTGNGCTSDSVHFFDNANPNGRPVIKWSWDFGDGATDIVKNPVHLFGAPGTFNVKYSIITDIGCLSDTIMKPVILVAPPQAKFGIQAPFCQGKTLSFIDSSSAFSGSTIVKWFWDFGDGTPPVVATTNQTQTHVYTTTGNFVITLRVELASGCTSPVFTRNINISPNPVAGFSFGNACLPSGTMQFTNSSTISDGSQNQFIYQWNFGDGSAGSTLTSPSHNYNSTGPFSASLVVTSNAGCKDSLTQAVNTIYAQPQAIFSMPAEVCYGTPVSFTDQSIAPNNSISQWQWNFGDGNTSSQQNPTHNYATSGTFVVTLQVTSQAGCTSTITLHNMVVNPLPVANFTFSLPDCETRLITITDASVANAGNIIQWTWDMGDGANFTNTNNLAFTHTYLQAGNYSISLKVETDKGCLSTINSKPIQIHPMPKPGFILPDNCLADPFSQFTDTSSISDGTEALFSYQWDFGDPNATGSNPNTSTVKNPKHKYSVVGPYTVTLIVTSVNGCRDTVAKQFTVNSTQPVSSFTINGANPLCSNNTASILNNSTIDVGKIVKIEIYWDNLNDPTNKFTIAYPLPGEIYNHTYPEFYSPATKDYQVKVIAYSGDSCYNTTFKTITLKATPQVVLASLPSVCADLAPFSLNQGSILNGLAGTPVYSGPGLTSGSNFNPALAGVGTHTIRYTFNAVNGCSNFKEQQITVYPVPTVSAGPDLFVLEGGNATLSGSGNGNGITYAWTPATWLNNPAIPQPVTTPFDDITYNLKIRSIDGCESSDQVFVKVLKSPAIPNTFSPNGDGIHDKWEIKYLETYPGATVEIFNRYGQLVFQSTGYSVPWDGTYKGKPLAAGTYYYLINPKNGRKQIAGFVDIIR